MLCRAGYALEKSQHPDHVLQQLRKKLTVRPPYDPQTAYGPPPASFKVYLETLTHMYIPRFYAAEVFGPVDVIPPPLSKTRLVFRGQLKANLQQPQAVQAATKAFAERGGGMLCVPTGYGKTTMALYLAAQLSLRTLVLVHKTCLADQWRERIDFFLEGAAVGRLQGQVEDVEGKNMVIAMIQSVCQKDYHAKLLSNFGLLIVDEAHHEAAPMFSQAMLKVNCPYVLALTATPERKDGMSFVNTWFLGPIFFSLQRRNTTTVTVRKVSFDCPAYKLPLPQNKRGQLNMALCINMVSENDRRNVMLVDLIEELAAEGRKVLVLSDRRNQCTALQEMCPPDITCGLYLGSMKPELLKQAEECQVILSTYQMMSEGIDIVALDSLIMATPKSDVNQSVGRILREAPGKVHSPLVIDVVDNQGVFHAQWQKRKKFYNSQGFSVISNDLPKITAFAFQ